MKDSASKPGPTEILHEDGWVPVGPYGLQRFKDGPDGRLLRLDEALYWMAHKQEWPRKKAVYETFSPLVQWDEADGNSRRQVLYMLNGEEHAYPISLGDRLNPRAVDVWGDLPFSYQDGYSHGTVREIADLWDESWPGYVQDPDDFYRKGWVSYCKAMKALAMAAEGRERWEKVYRERYYMNLGEWKERCKRAVRSLSRLTVPFEVAHELWGWGSVSVSVAGAEPASPFPLADFAALVAYRKAQKTANAAAGKPRRNISWGEGNQLDVLHAEYKRLGKNIAAAESMGKALGCTRQAVESALKKDWTPVVVEPFRGLNAA